MISFSVCTIKRPTFEKHYFYLLIYLSVEAAERELQSTESLAQVVDVAAHVGHARRQFQTPRRFGQQPVVQLEQPATEKKKMGSLSSAPIRSTAAQMDRTALTPVSCCSTCCKRRSTPSLARRRTSPALRRRSVWVTSCFHDNKNKTKQIERDLESPSGRCKSPERRYLPNYFHFGAIWGQNDGCWFGLPAPQRRWVNYPTRGKLPTCCSWWTAPSSHWSVLAALAERAPPPPPPPTSSLTASISDLFRKRFDLIRSRIRL